MDGRSFRAPITNHFVIPSNTWTIVQNSPIHDPWFIRHLRCTRGTYQRICQNVEVRDSAKRLRRVGKSKAERAAAAEASEKVIQRDLRSENSDLSSNRIKYALDELSKVQSTLSLSSGYVTEAIDAHLLARPKIEAKKPKQMIQQLLEAQTQAQAQQENQLKAQQDMQ
ncbi:hypothetical protein DYB26_007620, partial [Aphanomyces astaci]